MFLFCLVFAMFLCTSVYTCFVVTCWERADLLALVRGVYCEFVTFPFGILGQVLYVIVSIPDLCTLTYFENIVILCPTLKWNEAFKKDDGLVLRRTQKTNV